MVSVNARARGSSITPSHNRAATAGTRTARSSAIPVIRHAAVLVNTSVARASSAENSSSPARRPPGASRSPSADSRSTAYNRAVSRLSCRHAARNSTGNSHADTADADTDFRTAANPAPAAIASMPSGNVAVPPSSPHDRATPRQREPKRRAGTMTALLVRGPPSTARVNR